MVTSPRTRLLSFVTAGAFVVFTAVSIPARSEEPPVILGPVKPYEPILTAVGTKRILAFFEQNLGQCAVRSVVWDRMDATADTVNSAVQVRATLRPLQIMSIDGSGNETISLQCGQVAATLTVVDEQIVAAPQNER